MSKKEDRQKIFDKYGGRCAYCGDPLHKGWHVDEIDPIRRNKKWVLGSWKGDGYDSRHLDISEEEASRRGIRWFPNRYIEDGCAHPERLNTDNQNPACASCNINKHSDDLETFRSNIKQYVQSLNLYSTQYKIAKRYGLIKETDIEVKFYFETLN